MTIDILATLREAKEVLSNPLLERHEIVASVGSMLTAAIEQIEKAEPSLYEVIINGAYTEYFQEEPSEDSYDEGSLVKHYLHPAAPTIPENIDEIAAAIASRMISERGGSRMDDAEELMRFCSSPPHRNKEKE